MMEGDYMTDADRFVIKNTKDDACRYCGSRECYEQCMCFWCLNDEATETVIDDEGHQEKLCKACADVARGDLGRIKI